MSNKGSSYKAPSATDHFMEFMAMQQKVQAERQKSDGEKVQEKLGCDTEVSDRFGKKLYNLNSSLVLRQGVTRDELQELKKLHREKNEIFEDMRSTDDSVELKKFAARVEEIEFEMQKNWHFPQDRNFHEWYKVPKCKCPTMDNQDCRGTSRRIIFADCPVHGS